MLPRRLIGGRKILMTADAVGGIWTYAVDLGRELVSRGIAVTLAALGPDPEDAKCRAAADAGIELVVLGHAPEWLASGPAELAQAGASLAELTRRSGADLVQLNHPALGASARFDVPVVALCHSCVATWWEAVEGTPLPDAFAWQADLVGRGYRAATVLVAPSRGFAEATRKTYGLPQPPRVVFNGRAAAPASRSRQPARSALTIGRLWDRGKGLATLDRAAALTSVPVRAAGPLAGPDGSAIAFAHLQALGPLSEGSVRDLLAERPIFVSAASYEPFGLSVLEAAQAECALVLADIPTLHELWSDAALFVAVGDAAGFAAQIDRLADDLPLRLRLGDAARRRAERYRLDVQVDGMTELYGSLLHLADTGNHAA